MFKNLVQQLLVVTLASSIFTCGYVRAMEQSPSRKMCFHWDMDDVKENIIALIDKSEFDTLQAALDDLSKDRTQDSIEAHKALVGYVRSLSQYEIIKLFDKLQGESTLKMALRLVYAQTHKGNLDHLDCNDFFKKIQRWVSGSSLTQIPFFSQANLPYVLPLIEPITNISVITLNIYYCKLTCLPDSIGNLSKLECLNLSQNNLTSLPDSIGNLINLKELNLSFNQLTCLPYTIGNLSKLECLNLSNNQLTCLPYTIGNLVNLTSLNLTSNRLTCLPNLIGNLSKLTSLDLTSNKLTCLPFTIGNLRNVTWLSLSFNCITSLPDSIGNLRNLETLWFYDNNLSDVTKQNLRNYFKHIKNFYI